MDVLSEMEKRVSCRLEWSEGFHFTDKKWKEFSSSSFHPALTLQECVVALEKEKITEQ